MPTEFSQRVIRRKVKNKFLGSGVLDDPALLAAHYVNIQSSRESQYPITMPRASKMFDGCMRMFVVGHKNNIQKKEWSNTKNRLLFGIGNALHYWIQNEPDLFGDKRVGWWLCRGCMKVRQFGKPPTTPCKFCGANAAAAVYMEHGFRLNGKYPVSGHPDMFLRKDKVLRITELKSISAKEYVKLVAPLAAHECQLLTYMWGIPQDKTFPVKIDRDLGYLAYISKGYHQKELPIKMFPVPYNVKVVSQIKKKLSAYKRGWDNYPNKLPEPLEACVKANFTSWKAKECPVKNHCMALLDA